MDTVDNLVSVVMSRGEAPLGFNLPQKKTFVRLFNCSQRLLEGALNKITHTFEMFTSTDFQGCQLSGDHIGKSGLVFQD